MIGGSPIVTFYVFLLEAEVKKTSVSFQGYVACSDCPDM